MRFSERRKLFDGAYTITETWHLENILSQIKIIQCNLNNLLLEFPKKPSAIVPNEIIKESVCLNFLKDSLEEMLDNNPSMRDRFAYDIIRMENKTEKLLEKLAKIYPVLKNALLE